MLVISNIQSAEAQAVRLDAELIAVEERLRDGERALDAVNQAAVTRTDGQRRLSHKRVYVPRESSDRIGRY